MTSALRRVFADGFRAFFLAAGLFAVFSGVTWGLYLGVHMAGGLITDPSYDMAPHHWHGHEMIFGYAGAAISGFLLTAVPNWTGGTGAKPVYIGAVSMLWLACRMAMWWSASFPTGWWQLRTCPSSPS